MAISMKCAWTTQNIKRYLAKAMAKQKLKNFVLLRV